MLTFQNIYKMLCLQFLWVSQQQHFFTPTTRTCSPLTSLVAQMVKHLPVMWETQVRSLGQEDPLEKEMATDSSIIAWKISWMEPGRLQSMGSQRVGHNWAIKHICQFTLKDIHARVLVLIKSWKLINISNREVINFGIYALMNYYAATKDHVFKPYLIILNTHWAPFKYEICQK